MTGIKGRSQIKRPEEISTPQVRDEVSTRDASGPELDTTPELADEMLRSADRDKALIGDDKPDTSAAMAEGAKQPRGGKLPDLVQLRLPPDKDRPTQTDPDQVDTSQTGPTKTGEAPEKRYGYEIGTARPDTFAAEFDKNWGNKDGSLGELEAAMHFAAYALNDLYGSHIRFSMQESTIQQQMDGGATYVRINEQEFRQDFLDPLIEKGYPITMECQMGMLLEIAAPSHLKKAYGRPPLRKETLDLVAKTMARRHVPITDYCTFLTSRGGKQAYKDMLHTMSCYRAECDRIGWDPTD